MRLPWWTTSWANHQRLIQLLPYQNLWAAVEIKLPGLSSLPTHPSSEVNIERVPNPATVFIRVPTTVGMISPDSSNLSPHLSSEINGVLEYIFDPTSILFRPLAVNRISFAGVPTRPLCPTFSKIGRNPMNNHPATTMTVSNSTIGLKDGGTINIHISSCDDGADQPNKSRLGMIITTHVLAAIERRLWKDQVSMIVTAHWRWS